MSDRGAKEDIVSAGFESNGFENNRTGWPEPSAYIQWKGTDVCMDFHCECGAFCHFDGDFAYTVKCPHCQTIWEMPCIVYPRKVSERSDSYWVENAKPLSPDEEFCDGEGNAYPVE